MPRFLQGLLSWKNKKSGQVELAAEKTTRQQHLNPYTNASKSGKTSTPMWSRTWLHVESIGPVWQITALLDDKLLVRVMGRKPCEMLGRCLPPPCTKWVPWLIFRCPLLVFRTGPSSAANSNRNLQFLELASVRVSFISSSYQAGSSSSITNSIKLHHIQSERH